ncbi:MAG: tape measure protein [Cypionkella sp.]
MASNTDLRVRISADLGDIKQGLGLLRGELAKVKSQANTSFSGSGNALSSGIKNAHRELRAFAATYLSLAGAKMLSGIADEATQIRGRIREAKGDYQAILTLAKETRTGLLATTDLYTRMERATRGQGISQERLLKITKTVNQAVKLSYADTGTANAALTQFAQGLAAGKLRGQDLNSVIAGTPILAEAIAKGMGKQVGAIKKLGEEGKLTINAVLGALENQAKRVDEEFKRVPVTIGDAMTAIRNSFVDYIGTVDASTGASRRFATVLTELAENLPKLLEPLLDAVMLLIKNFDVLAIYIGVRIATVALPAMLTAIIAVRNAIIAARAATLTWSIALAALGGPVGIALAALAAALYYVFKRTDAAKEAAEEHTKALAENADMAKVSATEAKKVAEAMRLQAGETLKAAQASLAAARAQAAISKQQMGRSATGSSEASRSLQFAAGSNEGFARRAQADVTAAEKVYKDWGDRLAELAVEIAIPLKSVLDDADKPAGEAVKKIAASNALLQDSVKRALAELDRLYKASEISTKGYFAANLSLQYQAIDLQIEQARNELAITKDLGQRRKIEEQIIILQRDRADAGKKNAQDEGLAADAMVDKLGAVRAKLAEMDGDAGKAATIRIYAEYHDLFKQLEADSDKTGKVMVQNLVDRLISKEKFEAIRGKIQEVMSQLQTGTAYIAAQSELGAMGPGEAERQLFDLRQRSIAQLRTLRAEMVAYLAAQSAGTPEHTAAIAGLQQLDTELANTLASQNKFKNAIADQAVSALGGFFNDLIDGAKSFKEAFTDMVRSFLSGVAKMIAQELALRAVKAALKFFGGGSADGNVFTGSGKTAFAKGAAFALPGLMAFANGGAFTNQVYSNPTMFRFGQGGQFGVMGEAGPEAVMPLTRGPDGKLGVQSQGGGGGIVTTPIVAIGDDAIANALAGAAGERVVLTHVRANWEGLQRG